MKIKVIAVLSAAAMIASSAVTVAGAQTVRTLPAGQTISADAFTGDEAPADCPQVKSITPTLDGLKITWNAFAGAAKYRVFIFNGTSWKGIGDTASTSFEHKKLTNGTTYTYTVRALDKKGKFASKYYTEGWKQTFYSTPTVTSVQGVEGGLKISWNKVEGVNKYRIYIKNGSAWKRIDDVTGTSYTDENVTAGNSYTYTVRCMSDDCKTFLSHYTSGKTGTFVSKPQITGIQNIDGGSRISWNKCGGAAKYRVFVKNGTSWKGVGDTASTSFDHKPLSNNTTYTYTVRALDKNGSFASAYDTEGVSNKFFAIPVISAVESVNGGLKVSWNKVAGVNNYRIYVKNGGSWSRITDTASNSYTDKNVTSGKSYIYTVRCMSDDSKTFLSHYSNSGKSGTYVQTPSITKFENTATGTKITWNKVAGATKYRVFVKNGTSWKGLGDTTSTTYTHNGLTDTYNYSYTVRALNASGKFVSGYNNTGWSNRFFAPPAITSVTSTADGMKVVWKSKSGVAAYRIYRRTMDGTWSPLGDVTNNQFIDKTAPSNALYTYTMRYLNDNGVSISSHITNTKFYYNKAVANGQITYKGVTYVFNNGFIKQGYVTVNGKTYYYDANGVIQKNGIVGSDSDGYRYADSTGAIDTAYCGVVTSKGVTFNVINGNATKVKTEADKTLSRAIKEVGKCTNKSMSKSQKLWAAFQYIKEAYIERVPRTPSFHGTNWHIIYANDILEDGMGDCYSYGAAFAFMAKAIGYTNVYACNSGGHGWAEVDGKVYDPEWSRHHSSPGSYYGVGYNDPCDVDYKGGISAGEWWMHVKV